MKYLGIEHDSGHDAFTSEDNFRSDRLAHPAEYRGAKIIFEVESDCWEEAMDAWEKFRHHGSYNPVCPAECFTESRKHPGTLDADPRCSACRGKGWVNMKIWRKFKKRTR